MLMQTTKQAPVSLGWTAAYVGKISHKPVTHVIDPLLPTEQDVYDLARNAGLQLLSLPVEIFALPEPNEANGKE